MCDNMHEITPKNIAKVLFSDDPKDPNTYCILPFSQKYDDDGASFNFEILISVYLESFMQIIDAKKTDNDTDEYKLFEMLILDDLMFPNEWFKSIGYVLTVKEYALASNIDRDAYCSIILSFNKAHILEFIKRNISERYHFILNKRYKKTDKLEEIYATVTKKNKIYKIYFSELNVIKTDKQEVLEEQRKNKII